MFESASSHEKENGYWGRKFSELSDSQLLYCYAQMQRSQEYDIARRDRNEKDGMPASAEFSQAKITYDFATLNSARVEIEKRGLKAPTMQENEIAEAEEEKQIAAERSQEGGEKMKVSMTYTLENFSTGIIKQVTMEFGGADMNEIQEKILRHLMRVEMRKTTEIAKDAMITTPEGIVSFDDFMTQTVGK